MENKQQSATRQKIGRTTGFLALNSPWRVSKEKNRQRGHLLATSLHPTRHGELTKEKIGRSSCLHAMANEVTWEARKGG